MTGERPRNVPPVDTLRDGVSQAVTTMLDRECELGGHRPDRVIVSVDLGVAVSAYCDCRKVMWLPNRAEAKS